MFFLNKKKKRDLEKSTPRIESRRSSSGRRFPLEVKHLAVQAREAGLGPKEVAELIGAGASTVSKWHKFYQEGGAKPLLHSHPLREHDEFAVNLNVGSNSIERNSPLLVSAESEIVCEGKRAYS